MYLGRYKNHISIMLVFFITCQHIPIIASYTHVTVTPLCGLTNLYEFTAVQYLLRTHNSRSSYSSHGVDGGKGAKRKDKVQD